MRIKDTGIDTAIKSLKDIARRAEALEGSHQVAYADLFTPSFMAKYTKADSINSFFENSGFDVDSEEALKAIPDELWDQYVSANSDFHNWEDMIRTAGKEYFAHKLGLD